MSLTLSVTKRQSAAANNQPQTIVDYPLTACGLRLPFSALLGSYYKKNRGGRVGRLSRRHIGFEGGRGGGGL